MLRVLIAAALVLATPSAHTATASTQRVQSHSDETLRAAQLGIVTTLKIAAEKTLRCPNPQQPQILAVRSKGGPRLSAEPVERLPGNPEYGLVYYRWAVEPFGHVYFQHLYGVIENFSPRVAYVRWACG